MDEPSGPGTEPQVNLGQIQSVHIPEPIGAYEPVDVQGDVLPKRLLEAPPAATPLLLCSDLLAT